ncbi:MAG: DUF1822 family protein, partial [Bacteroidota bacterium]
CSIPPEAHQDRIGYVVVRLHEGADIVQLVGFAPRINSEILLLNQLRNIEEFPGYIAQIRPINHLYKWLEQEFEPEWSSIETLLSKDSQLFFKNRMKSNSICRAKLLEWEAGTLQKSVVIVLIVSPDKNENLDILIQLHCKNSRESKTASSIAMKPTLLGREVPQTRFVSNENMNLANNSLNICLPEGIEIDLLIENDQVAQKATTDSNTELISFQPFTGNLYDEFELRFKLGES